MTPTPTKNSEKKSDFSKSFLFSITAVAVIFTFIYFKFIPSDRYETFIGSGDSMAPTFQDGDEIVVDNQTTPLPGDAIVFDCLQCEDLPIGETLAKRIYQTNEYGCYWLIGDNKEISYDSRQTGWLCPEQHIKVHGVVVKLNGENY